MVVLSVITHICRAVELLVECDNAWWQHRSINVTTVQAARRNGTMYAHVFILPATAESPRATDWMSQRSVSLTKYEVPQASTFQLIGDASDLQVQPTMSSHLHSPASDFDIVCILNYLLYYLHLC